MGVTKGFRLPALIWLFSIGLIYSTTLIGKYLVGTDLHLEYYFANQTLINGWDASVPHAYNGALSVTLLAPFLSKLLHIDLYTVFKFVFPFIYSFTPVVLYFIYRKYVSDSKAFWAAIFFILVPTFFIEVTGIGREQIGELMMALTFLCMVNKKWWLFGLFGILTILAHYSMGYIMAFYIVVYAVGMVVLTHKVNWRLFAVVGVILLGGYVFLNNVADGIPLKSAEYVGASYIDPIAHPQGLDSAYSVKPGIYQYIDIGSRDTLVKMALGLDLLDAPIEGKIFRLTQFAIQALIILGGVIALRKRYNPQLLALMAGGVLILLACVFVPSFASILNPTRFYHLAMFFLPVALVIGISTYKYWPRVIVLLALLYFSFTSGLVFEALKLQPDTVNVPYSIAASQDRLDLGTKYSDDDIKCAEWLSQFDTPVYADIYGLLIIQETLGLHPLYMLTENVTTDCFIFLRSYNQETQTITLWRGAGLREYVSYAEFDFSEWNIVFQSGNAVIMRK